MSEQQYTDKQLIDDIYKIMRNLSTMSNKKVHILAGMIEACADKHEATVHQLQLVKI